MVDVAVSTTTSLPRRGSAWSVETNPAYAGAWLESLAPFNNLQAARELYQGLRALNRTELDPAQRLALMQLYRGAARQASESLQGAFARVSFPMSEKLRRLASSLCQLHMEMAQGYKLSLQGLGKSWLTPWRRRQVLGLAAERVLYHLCEVLLRSYQLYLPYPPGVWREAHALYRQVALYERQDEPVETEEGKDKIRVSVSQRYRRMLLLGAANPYQMPYGECAMAYRFIGHWIDKARILEPETRPDGSGCFLVDATVDAPPAPLGRAVPQAFNDGVRMLDASELVRAMHAFLRRLEKGEPLAEIQIGIEGLDSSCRDMLQRLHRVYAQVASRRHTRIKRNETIMICAGLGALHFFCGGQRSFAPAPVAESTTAVMDEQPPVVESDEDADYIALDEPAVTRPVSATPESFRVDHWLVRDVSAQGLSLTQQGETRVRLRVGDVVGIQRTNQPGHWSVGLVRWFKGNGEDGFDVGVELIAPEAVAASVRPVTDGMASVPALKLPAVAAAHRPASVLVGRGVLEIGQDCFVVGADSSARRVRVLDAIEHTNAVQQVVVGKVVE